MPDATDLAGVCTGDGPCVTTPIGPGPNWVTRVDGLPLYIRAIAQALLRKGLSESQAVRLAVGTVRRWAKGGGHVTPATRARAAAALAEWERKKAQAHVHDHALEAPMPVDLAVDMLARLAPDRAALIRLAKKVEGWPDGPKKTGMKKRIAARAHTLHVPPDGDGDWDMDVPRKDGLKMAVPAGDLDTAQRRKLAEQGKALPGGRFPIRNRSDLAKAIRMVGLAKGSHAAVRAYIRRQAAALGAMDMIPAGWKPDGTLTLRSRLTGRGKK